MKRVANLRIMEVNIKPIDTYPVLFDMVGKFQEITLGLVEQAHRAW